MEFFCNIISCQIADNLATSNKAYVANSDLANPPPPQLSTRFMDVPWLVHQSLTARFSQLCIFPEVTKDHTTRNLAVFRYFFVQKKVFYSLSAAVESYNRMVFLKKTSDDVKPSLGCKIFPKVLGCNVNIFSTKESFFIPCLLQFYPTLEWVFKEDIRWC